MKINNNATPLKKQPSFGNAALGKKCSAQTRLTKLQKSRV